MAKSISVDDETYKLIAEFAKEDDRPISNALSRLIKLGLGISRPSEKKEVETPNRVGSQANNHLEEVLGRLREINEDLKLDSLRAWSNKMAIEEAWTDEQAEINTRIRKQELLAERDSIASILKENGMAIGM